MRRKIRKLLAATLIVGTLTFAPEICGVENFPVARADVKLYTAMGVDYGNEYESQDIVKLRARDKAIKNATKQAGVYLKTYSRSINNELTDDEILAITSNAYEVVGEVRYNRTVKQVTDQITLIVWEATVDVNVDDGEITKWVKRDDRDRSTLISQTRESQTAAEENDRKVEDLRRRSQNVSDDAGRAQLQTEFNQADNEFLSNQKVEEANRASYRGDLEETAKLYSEAIELNPKNALAYLSRATLYSANVSVIKHNLQDSPRFKRVKSHGDDAATYYKLALADFDKAIELTPNDARIYARRGYAHYNFGKYPQALADYDNALRIDPACLEAYMNRNMYYRFVLKDDKLALADLNRAIELNPDKAGGYSLRSLLYKNSKQYSLALADINKVIQLEPGKATSYYFRGDLYLKLGDYNRAVEDFNRARELDPDLYVVNFGLAKAHEKLGRYDLAIEDYTQIIKDSSEKDAAIWYYKRGKCYEALGDKTKAKADIAKAKALGFSL